MGEGPERVDGGRILTIREPLPRKGSRNYTVDRAGLVEKQACVSSETILGEPMYDCCWERENS